MTAQPIIRTRPITSSIDFCWFVEPKKLADNLSVLQKIKSRINAVLNTDILCGGPMLSDRWHVLKIENFLLIGWATIGFDYKDEKSRTVRGYYGFLFDDAVSGRPSLSSFQSLFSRYVEPNLYATVIDLKQVGDVDVPMEPFSLKGDSARTFNDNCDVVKYFGMMEHSFEDLFSAAIEHANQTNGFEFVYGLNINRHAERDRFMNVVTHEQKFDKSVRVGVFTGSPDDPKKVAENPKSLGSRKGGESMGCPNQSHSKMLILEQVDGKNSWHMGFVRFITKLHIKIMRKHATCTLKDGLGSFVDRSERCPRKPTRPSVKRARY